MGLIYLDFLYTVEAFRANMSDPRWWISTYKSLLYSILSLTGRISFSQEQNVSKWIGPDATLVCGSSVTHTIRMFVAAASTDYCDYLPS